MILLEIDSNADTNSTISIGIQPDSHTQPETMRLLGTEKDIHIENVKKCCHCCGDLSSYYFDEKPSRTGGVQNMNKFEAMMRRKYISF